jgi:hypothetical protein
MSQYSQSFNLICLYHFAFILIRKGEEASSYIKLQNDYYPFPGKDERGQKEPSLWSDYCAALVMFWSVTVGILRYRSIQPVSFS